MPIDPSVVDRVARLARLELSDEERQRFARQLGSILEYCATLNELDTEHVEPTSHVLTLTNVFRDDVAGTPLPRDAVRSEEHTSELQSRGHLVCRLLLEKKN